MSSGSFKIIYKICLEIIYLIYMYKKDLALNNAMYTKYKWYHCHIHAFQFLLSLARSMYLSNFALFLFSHYSLLEGQNPLNDKLMIWGGGFWQILFLVIFIFFTSLNNHYRNLKPKTSTSKNTLPYWNWLYKSGSLQLEEDFFSC